MYFLDKIPKNISTETDLSPRAKASKDHITSNSDELNFKVRKNNTISFYATNILFLGRRCDLFAQQS